MAYILDFTHLQQKHTFLLVAKASLFANLVSVHQLRLLRFKFTATAGSTGSRP